MVTGRSKRRMLNLKSRNNCNPKYGRTGVKRKWIPSNNIPDINKIAKPKSEAKELEITLFLFANDTTTIGERCELDEGV